MSKSLVLIAVLCAAAILTLPARAQNAKKEAAVKPADSPFQVVLNTWNEIGRKLIAMAEDFPEDKYDFKPSPAQRSFAEQLIHAANATYYFTNAALGQKPPGDDPKRDQFKTKAEIAAFLKKSFADGAAAIQAKGEKGMSDIVIIPYANQQVRISDLAWSLIEHSGEHYGQLVVYYRLSGLVPPESRPKK